MYRFSSNNSSTFVKVLLEHRHGDRTTVISPDYCILTDDTFRRHVVRSMTYSTMSVMLKGTYTREISKRKVTSVLRRQDHKQLLVFWIPRVNFSTRHRLHVWRVKGNCDVWWLKTRPGEFRKTWDVDTSHKNELRLYVSAYFSVLVYVWLRNMDAWYRDSERFEWGQHTDTIVYNCQVSRHHRPQEEATDSTSKNLRLTWSRGSGSGQEG